MGQAFINPAALMQFLNSPQGIDAQKETLKEVEAAFDRVETHKRISLGLNINAANGQLNQIDALGGPMLSFIEQRLPPTLCYFSFFPADRALPMGEVTMQIGAQDAQQQLESHNSQPHLKYQRLKNMIVNSLILKGPKEETVQADFELIFKKLLKQKSIESIALNEIGLLSVMIKEASGKLVDIDNLSSGEKNIVLTFLIIARSIAKGGIALFDEPELHLNPSVSRDLLSFVQSEYAFGRDIQFIMCTHSPEILASAFKETDCRLLHLKSPTDITPIGKQSLDEYSMALQRLGIAVGETLFYEGTIFVEGDSDVKLLENAFPELLRRFKLKEIGGRREIEKAIEELQSLEKRGHVIEPIYLIFDKDGIPSKLEKSQSVTFIQWKRYCIENYLIELDVISELLRDSQVTKTPITSAGEVHRITRNLAFEQIPAIVAREVYNSYEYQNASVRREDLKAGTIEGLGSNLYGRMASARDSLSTSSREEWIGHFSQSVKERCRVLEIEWDDKWKENCDGKMLMTALYRAANPKIPESAFIERIVSRMREVRSENWLLMKGLLEELIGARAG